MCLSSLLDLLMTLLDSDIITKVAIPKEATEHHDEATEHHEVTRLDKTRIAQAAILKDETNGTAAEDRTFCEFMNMNSLSLKYIRMVCADMRRIFFIVKLFNSEQNPFDCRTKTSVNCTTVYDLYYLIENGFLSSNHQKMVNSYWTLLFNGEVLQWSTIYHTLIKYYKSINVTYDISDDDLDWGDDGFDMNKLPTIHLLFGTISESSVLDTSKTVSSINRDALLSFGNIICVQWSKNPKFRWYLNNDSWKINPSILVDSTGLRYHCDRIDQITSVDYSD